MIKDCTNHVVHYQVKQVMPRLLRFLPCPDRYTVKFCLELCVLLQFGKHSRRQSRFMIDSHVYVHFHQDLEDITILDALSILGHPKRSVLRYFWQVWYD